MGDLIKRKVFISQTYAVCCVPGTEGEACTAWSPGTVPCRDEGKSQELLSADDGSGGEGMGDFPEDAAPELSAEGCLNTSQEKDLGKVLEEEQSHLT